MELDEAKVARATEEAIRRMHDMGCSCTPRCVSFDTCDVGHIHGAVIEHDDDCALVIRVSRVQASRFN